jgi:hypothetical protein
MFVLEKYEQQKKSILKNLWEKKYFKNLWEKNIFFFLKKNRIAAVPTDAKSLEKCKKYAHIATVCNRRKNQRNRRYHPSGGYSDGLIEPPLNDLATPHFSTLFNRRIKHLAAV